MSLASLTGAATTMNAFKNCLSNIDDDIKKAVDEVADEVKSKAQGLAEQDSGDMAGSIDTEVIKDSDYFYGVKVGPSDDLRSSNAGTPYPVFNEFGTARMNKQPFLRPALKSCQSSGVKKIGDAVKKNT